MITIHTDGSCFPNPGGPGGWSAIIENGQDKERISGGEEKTTNNRMEIMPVLRSLQHIPANSNVVLFSDSQYVVNSIGCWKGGRPHKKTGWMVKWKKNNWHRPNDPLKNVDLWKEVYEAVAIHESIEICWVRGHNGNQLNEECDALANKARKSKL